MSVDVHCHLDLYQDPFHVADICKQKDLDVLSITTTPKAWDGTRKLSIGRERIRTALGFHPQLAHQRFAELELFDALLPQTEYVGEIGLDGGKNFREHWNVQRSVLQHVLRSVTKAGGRILSIHSRACASAVLDELKDVSGILILHWFTGNKGELKRAIDMGCWFSVGPAMLRTKRGKELVTMIPKEKVLTETDGPFAQVGGAILMPWHVEYAYTILSGIWGCAESEVEQQVQFNLSRIMLAL